MKRIVTVALGLALAACGIPEEKYKAAVEDGNKAKAAQASEAEKVKALEGKVGQLQQKLAAVEAVAAGAAAEAAVQAGKAQQAQQAAVELAAAATQLAQKNQALEKRSAEYENLSHALSKEIQAGRIEISELQGRMTVRLGEKVLFPSGSATLSKAGKETMKTIADALKDLQGRIVRVEGYTDDVPIKSAAFPSNWELSAGRAISVVRFLQDQGVDPTKLAAVGYGQFQPIATNETPEGRAQNRRIEISLGQPPSDQQAGRLPAAAPAK